MKRFEKATHLISLGIEVFMCLCAALISTSMAPMQTGSNPFLLKMQLDIVFCSPQSSSPSEYRKLPEISAVHNL